jgi:GDP-4-dehydro-6-deoxy-D-mannose reductase
LRVIITGAAGFVGRHLLAELRTSWPDAALHGTVLGMPDDRLPDVARWYGLDLRDEAAVNGLIDSIQPTHILHLAALASVAQSFNAPWETLENNILSQVNLLEACRRLSQPPRLLITGSAEVYGPVKPEDVPLDEDAPLMPNSPYAVSKVAQDMLGLQYFQAYDLPVMRARAFNHIGPGQTEHYVATAFAMQIARIEAGQQAPVIHVGDLSAKRDFTDVRDVVRAYRLITSDGAAGDVYNIASGKSISIRDLLDHLLALSTADDISIVVDPDRLRPSRVPVLEGDATRLRTTTGWQPTIPFTQTLSDILDDCRVRVQQ